MNNHPQHIVIDGRMINATGVGRYITELVKGLVQLDTLNRYTLITLPNEDVAWLSSAANFSILKVNAPIYSFAEQTTLAKALRKLAPDLVHFTSFNSPVFYNGRRVTTVHDLTLLDYSVARGSMLKKLSYSLKQPVMKWQIKSVLKKSLTTITDTEYVRTQLIQRQFVDAPRIHAIHLGPAPTTISTKLVTAPVHQPYLLHIGNFFPYKNLGKLIEAMPAILKQQPDCKLILVGKKDVFQSQLEKQVSSLGLSDTILFTGFVSDQAVYNYYQYASLYVLPSLSEGFGLPGLEAMSHNLPVVSSNASCLPEVYGDAASYFDPLDAHDIAAKIVALFKDKQQQATLKKAGKIQIAKYSWEQTAAETLAVYKKALKQ